jgi:hypothetical protein
LKLFVGQRQLAFPKSVYVAYRSFYTKKLILNNALFEVFKKKQNFQSAKKSAVKPFQNSIETFIIYLESAQ